MRLGMLRGLRLSCLLVLALTLTACAALGSGPAPSSLAADRAYLAEDYAGAAQAYEQYLHASPEDVRAWYRLGNSYVMTGRPQTATTAYRRVLELDPSHARARHNLGLVYLQLGVDELLRARNELPAMDLQGSGTLQYMACVMETFMGREDPASCREALEEGRPD